MQMHNKGFDLCTLHDGEAFHVVPLLINRNFALIRALNFGALTQ